MRYYYDFHIHTALSPCGDNDMTPNNVVNMSLLKGLDIIAVTDHNSMQNAAAVAEVGKRNGLIVVFGMEIETAEEVHVVALFPDGKSARKVQDIIYRHMNGIGNRTEIFGEQRILNDQDELQGSVDQLLITAASLMIEEVFQIVTDAGGVCIPAHVDRDSHSILSNLGMIPEDLPVKNIRDFQRLRQGYLSRGKSRAKEIRSTPKLRCPLPVGHFRERKLYRDRAPDNGCG